MTHFRTLFSRFGCALLAAILAGSGFRFSAAAEASSSDAAGAAAPSSADIIITEVMVKNHATLRDGDGDFPDWIELYNNSGRDLNLDGWSLSDRDNRSGLVFPAFRLPADTYFVVYASGKDRPEELHTPFSLAAEEVIYLKAPDGTLADSLVCPDQEADVSYARAEDGSFRRCLYPTPWRENTTSAYDNWQRSL